MESRHTLFIGRQVIVFVIALLAGVMALGSAAPLWSLFVGYVAVSNIGLAINYKQDQKQFKENAEPRLGRLSIKANVAMFVMAPLWLAIWSIQLVGLLQQHKAQASRKHNIEADHTMLDKLKAAQANVALLKAELAKFGPEDDVPLELASAMDKATKLLLGLERVPLEVKKEKAKVLAANVAKASDEIKTEVETEWLKQQAEIRKQNLELVEAFEHEVKGLPKPGTTSETTGTNFLGELRSDAQVPNIQCTGCKQFVPLDKQKHYCRGTKVETVSQ